LPWGATKVLKQGGKKHEEEVREEKKKEICPIV